MQHLFASGRFEGDRADYHRWQNSCIDHVREAHRGMPITLAVENNLTVNELAQTITIYPSLSGSVTEAGRQLMLHELE